MPMTPVWPSRLHRPALLGTLVLALIGILPGFLNPVMLPKATVVVLGAVLLLALAAMSALLRGAVRLPWSPPVAALAVLVGVMAVVTLLAEDPGTSLIGRYTRHAGLAEYSAYAVLLVGAVALYQHRRLNSLTATLLASLALVLGYGTVQLFGADPITWSSGLDEPLFSFLGNTNYASAVVGILVPLAVAVAVQRENALHWRAASAVLALWAMAYVVLLRALQGPIIAVLGTALVLTAATGVAGPVRRLRSVGVLGRAAAVLVAAAVTVPLVLLVVEDLPKSLHQRTQLWAAAWGMFLDRPLLGTGLDGYGDHFLAYRPVEHAQERGLAVADAAHQVPLSMLAHGGLLLGLAWAAFVVTVGVVLVRGLRRTTGDRRVLLAGYGGGWLGYQVQSLVSLDVPPVALLHFITAAGVLLLAGPVRVAELRTGRLPRPAALVAASLVLLLAVAAVGQVLRPLRADANAALAIRAAQGGDLEQALASGERALRFNPVEPSYQRAQAKRIVRTAPERGLVELQRSASMEPGSVAYAQDVVDLAERLDDVETARAWREEVLRRDPNNVRLLLATAAQRAATGDLATAERRYERALLVQPRQPDVYVALAEVQTASGDDAAAERTWSRLASRYPEDSRLAAWREQRRAQQ